MTNKTLSGLAIENFQTSFKRKDVQLIVLTSALSELCITNFGSTFVLYSIKRDDSYSNLILSLPSIQSYIQNSNKYVSLAVGLYSNRIANGVLKINSETFNLTINDPPNNLHTGLNGFHCSV
jgi:aldose 1-epimerase